MLSIEKEIWDRLLVDAQEYENRGKAISYKFLMKKYKITRWLATLWKFCLDNRDVIAGKETSNNSKEKYLEEVDGVKELTPDLIAEDLQKRKFEAMIKGLKQREEVLLKEIENVNDRYDFALQITDDKPYLIKKHLPIITPKTKKSSAVAIAILSDVHVEETVTLEMTNGINEYNPEISKVRVDNFFSNLLKLVEKERTHSDINTLVLGLLGDFITGYIHEDLKESNSLSPTEATTFIREVLIDNIINLYDKGNFDKIIIPCTPGNHGRTTHKKRFATGYKNSYEWMMYQDMKKTFSSRLPKKYGDNIEFITSQNELIYLDVYDYKMRFGHGDHFKYGGGIGGITIPLKKWLMRMNEQIHADMTFLGHWHNILTEVTEDCMLNGSVIGANSYSMNFGGPSRNPQQIFTLLDKKRGFTIRTHIDVI
jgi:hypothetical protein